MKSESSDSIEGLLESAAPAARREPPPQLRAHVLAALEPRTADAGGRVIGAHAPAHAAHEQVSGALGIAPRSWRERTREIAVAAAVVVAAGAWIFAFVSDSPHGVGVGTPPLAGMLGVGPSPLDPGVAQSRLPITALAQATPSAVHAALDGRLTSELDGIAHDAAGALHFLVGRLPAPLVMLASDDATR
jgi:hypothetical protein